MPNSPSIYIIPLKYHVVATDLSELTWMNCVYVGDVFFVGIAKVPLVTLSLYNSGKTYVLETIMMMHAI